MRDLPPPEFVKIDPAQVEADLVARYEARTGKTLYPAQIERLMLDQIAYAHSLALVAIQGTAEKMLVRRSSGVILDYLGDLVGTPRLLATPARCKIRLTLRDAGAAPVVVPAGSRVATADRQVLFALDADALVGPQGVTADATCSAAGARGNGLLPGQVSLLEPDLPVAAANVTTTDGGADDELDDRYKERIILAPEAYTTAGSYGAYRFHAMAAHQSIIDVAVHGASEGQPAGHIALYPLVESGMPSDLILSMVDAEVSSDRRRPLSDTVNVYRPDLVEYSVRATLVFYDTANRAETTLRARAALDAYLAQRQHQLGADLIPEQLSAALQVPGVYRAQIHEPALTVLVSNQWATCVAVTLSDGGSAHG
ncbi:baseplate J/gp47 family protein [Alcaligenaceae bacterium]|nr:baseplate J/gp47 family protein [Alcaligenaceae bacterium]